MAQQALHYRLRRALFEVTDKFNEIVCIVCVCGFEFLSETPFPNESVPAAPTTQ